MIHEIMAERILRKQEESDREWTESHKDRVPRLSISDIGWCRRKAIYGAYKPYVNHPLHVDVTHPFDEYLLTKFEEGSTMEQMTSDGVQEHYKGTSTDVSDNEPWRHGHWSGRPDLWIVESGRAIIVEHKTTEPQNFRYGNRLPYDHHLYQLMGYWILAKRLKLVDLSVDLVLYYRGFGNWAEFDVVPKPGGAIHYYGEVNGEYKAGTVDYNVEQEMLALETYFKAEALPEKYDSPFTERFACTKKNKAGYWPNCAYFGVCWPGCPQSGPFDP